MYAILLGGASMFLAALCVRLVDDRSDLPDETQASTQP